MSTNIYPQSLPPVGMEKKVNYDHPSFPMFMRSGRINQYSTKGGPCHWHEDFEFVLIISGHVSVHIDGQLVNVGEREGLFINSRRLHYAHSVNGEDCIYLCIQFSPSLLNLNPYVQHNFLAPLAENQAIPYIHLKTDVEWQRQILRMFLEMRDVYTDRVPAYELDLISYFFHIISLLCRNMPKDNAAPVSSKEAFGLTRIKQIMNYISEHFKEPLTLEMLADSAGISPTTCSRLFHNYLRRTPIEYLTEVRLDYSCTLLKDTRLSMTEIAYQAGFSDSSYYTKRFRKHYGCTPSEYRREKRDD